VIVLTGGLTRKHECLYADVNIKRRCGNIVCNVCIYIYIYIDTSLHGANIIRFNLWKVIKVGVTIDYLPMYLHVHTILYHGYDNYH